MCLYSNQILPRRATKDIVCYKRMTKLSPGLYITPYYYFRVHRDDFSLELDPRGKPIRIRSKSQNESFHTIVCGGYFHTYGSCDYALQMKLPINSEVIIKCIIPKGSLYWKGIANGNSISYELASDRIIFVEEVDMI